MTNGTHLKYVHVPPPSSLFLPSSPDPRVSLLTERFAGALAILSALTRTISSYTISFLNCDALRGHCSSAEMFSSTENRKIALFVCYRLHLCLCVPVWCCLLSDTCWQLLPLLPKWPFLIPLCICIFLPMCGALHFPSWISSCCFTSTHGYVQLLAEDFSETCSCA